MHGREKSDPAIVATKPANKAGRPAAEPVERRAGAEGKRAPAKHAPGAGPGKRVPGAGARTRGREATEEGTVHRALPPSQSIDDADGVLRAQAGRRPGDRRADMAGL